MSALSPEVLAEPSRALGPEAVSDRLLDRLAFAHDTFPLALKEAEAAEHLSLPAGMGSMASAWRMASTPAVSPSATIPSRCRIS